MNTRSGFDQDPGRGPLPSRKHQEPSARRLELDDACILSPEDPELIRSGHEQEDGRRLDHWAEALTEQAPIGLFYTDTSGHCLHTNRTWQALTQRTDEEAAGMGWTRTVHPEDREEFLSEWSRFARTGLAFHLQYRIVRPDGTDLCVLGQARTVYNEAGEVLGCVGSLTDLTQRQGLEREQLKLSKLDSLGVLAGGIAHDFNNQLTPVILNLAHVLEQELDEDTRERLAEAKSAAEEASNLTRQLLTFARGGDPMVQTIELPNLLRRSLNFALRGTPVRGELAIDAGLWPVKVDSGQVNQAIQNLVINARQAMPGSGKVTISAENVFAIRHPSLPKIDGRFVHISVADTGSGIEAEDLEKIFDPYFTTKSSGHGLGLSSTLSIVRKHQGQIAVVSEPGQGTTFSIYLPASDEEPIADEDDTTATAPVKAPKKTAHDETKRFRILVMDDEKLIRASTQMLLTKLGYEVLTAADGEAALSIYEERMGGEEPIDLVLMDLTIPGGMGGKDAIKALKELDPSAKAMVFSGYSNDRVMANYSDFGFCDAINKPFQPQRLAALLRQHLAGDSV